MAAEFVVKGQRVAAEKVERSKVLRKEMTPAEQRLWSELRKKEVGGFRFRRQQVVDGFIVDFYCHRAGLVVEADGGVHDEQQVYDVARDEILAARGIRILRFGNDAVMNHLGTVVEAIRAAIIEQAIGARD